jgi:hypothetical protein
VAPDPTPIEYLFLQDLRLAQLEGRHSIWIHATAHLIKLMGMALQRANPPRNKGVEKIIRRRNVIVVHFLDEGVDQVGFGVAVAEVIGPVYLISRSVGNMCRKIDQVLISDILHVE